MNSLNDLPIIIIGTGGHARVLADSLLAANRPLTGFIDPAPQFNEWCGIPVLGDDSTLQTYSPADIALVNGIGAVPFRNLRQIAGKKFMHLGYRFTSVIHPSAIISPETNLADDVQILAGALLQNGVTAGTDVIINTGARIDHDCSISATCHIAPGAVLCGNVRLAQGVHIGSGATVIQEIDIGADTVIGAGTTITESVDSNQVVRTPEVIIESRRR